MSDQGTGTNEGEVVQLVDAGVPADHGLSSLGLLMQLAGSVLAAYAGIVAFLTLFAMRGSGETMWMFLILGMCIARKGSDGVTEASYVQQIKSRYPESAEAKAIPPGECQ